MNALIFLLSELLKGCYGYELYGQKYSTNYIADGKGLLNKYNEEKIILIPI